MKILTGRFKGRTVAFRPAPGLRPTADKVRKALTDLFAGWIDGRRVLDLYSGTGSLGMELLSAGASAAVFVEADSGRAKAIRQWLEEAGVARDCRVWPRDAASAIEVLRAESETFDLIVLDPPYEDQTVETVLARLKILASSGGFLAYECRAGKRVGEIPGFTLLRDRTYGQTRLKIYKKDA